MGRPRSSGPNLSSKDPTYQRELRRIKRLAVLMLLGGICSNCGESDEVVLQVDHITPIGRTEYRKQKRTAQHSYWNKILKDPNACYKYQVLCANCHVRKTRQEQGIH